MKSDNTSVQKQKLEKLEAAIEVIAPWLSASLSDPALHCCAEYTAACNLVFEADRTPDHRRHNIISDGEDGMKRKTELMILALNFYARTRAGTPAAQECKELLSEMYKQEEK